MCSAVRRRMFENGTIWSSSRRNVSAGAEGVCGAAAAGTADGAGAGAVAGAGAGAGTVAEARGRGRCRGSSRAPSSTTLSTSSRVIRPPTPVPVTSAALIALSAKSFRTTGERTNGSAAPSLLGDPAGAASAFATTGAGAGAGGTGGGAGAGAGGAAAGAGGVGATGATGAGAGAGARAVPLLRRCWCRGLARPPVPPGRQPRAQPPPDSVVADDGKSDTDFDRLTFGDEDLGQDSSGRRRDLGVDLVRGDLEEGLVTGDRVTDALHPAGDGPLGHSLAQLRHRDISQCAFPFRSTPASSRRMIRIARGAAE